MVSVSYSLLDPHPTPPAFTFCLETTCLQSIDGGLLTSLVSNISHNNLWSSWVQKPLNPAEWGTLCLKKTTTVLLTVIHSCGHLEKLSMWLRIIHMTDYYFTIANVESRIFGSHGFCHGAHWMDECIEILVLAGGWLEEKFKRWPHRRIIIHPLFFPHVKLGSALGQQIMNTDRLEMSHGSTSPSVWDQKLLFKQNHKF